MALTTNKHNNPDTNDYWSWETLSRDLQHRPIAYPLLKAYSSFMDIKRYDKMPFYAAPAAETVVNYEDKIITFIDFLVDAHEDSRNTADKNRSFYQRSIYTYNNFLRYQNDTMGNMMFEVCAGKPDHARLNSIITQRNLAFYASATAVHSFAFAWLSLVLRFRRITLIPTLAIGTVYFSVFQNVNNILYKLIVDQAVIRETRRLGYGAQVQPVGERTNKGINYV